MCGAFHPAGYPTRSHIPRAKCSMAPPGTPSRFSSPPTEKSMSFNHGLKERFQLYVDLAQGRIQGRGPRIPKIFLRSQKTALKCRKTLSLHFLLSSMLLMFADVRVMST